MRARNLKPGFFSNEQVGQCTFAARLLFQGLWCLADREGRLQERPKRIWAEVFPYDHDLDIIPLLGELEKQGLIVRYQAGGMNLISIPSWPKHANPHHKEQQSELPPPVATVDDRPKRRKRVYFIQMENKIKIGSSFDTNRRLFELQITSASKLTLLGEIDGSVKVEKALHSRFAHLREEGEWFRAENELKEFVKNVLQSSPKDGSSLGQASSKVDSTLDNLVPLNPESGIPLPESGILNPEATPAAKAEDQKPKLKKTPDAADCAAQWQFAASAARSTTKHDDPREVRKSFEEWHRQGIPFEAMLAAILDPKRVRTESFWEFEKREIKPRLQSRSPPSVNRLAEKQRQIRERMEREGRT